MYGIILEGKRRGQATGLVLDDDLKVVDIYYSEYDLGRGITTHYKRKVVKGSVILSNNFNGFSISPIEGKRIHHGTGSLQALFRKLGYRTLIGSIEDFGRATVPSEGLTKALIKANSLNLAL